jgi:cytochrome c556
MKLWSIALPLLAGLAACSSQPEGQQTAASQQTLHDIMKGEIDVRADEVWAIGNAAIDEQASIDPAKMTNADWDKLATSSAALRQAALDLANLDPIVVVRPGEKIVDEGVPGGDTAAEVQATVDRNPQGFREMANTLAGHMGELATAAQAHDAGKAGPLINQLDAVCEACHLDYWYPSQKALVEEFMDSGVVDPTTQEASPGGPQT